MLKVILLKISRNFVVMIWNIIKIFRWNKNIDLRNVKKIIFNRKDRIWDAVVSKPFIILFSKYIKEELKLNIDIEVECSKYNEFVFREWNWEEHYKIKAKETNLNSEEFSFIKYTIIRLKSILRNKKITKNKTIVFIDLVGDVQQVQEWLKIHKSYMIWWNLLLNNYILDYSLYNNYVSGNDDNLIVSYTKLVSQCFNLQNFETYINENIEYFFEDYNDSNDKKWILIFVWNKTFRNLPSNVRMKIINWIWNKYSDEKIVIIDDNQNIIYNELINIWAYSDNIVFKKNEFSLEELKNFSKKFKLIIWIDWWGFNYIRTCTNSLEIFTLANPKVWSIFTWKHKYNETNLWNNRFLNKVRIWNKSFWYTYKESRLLPTYDIRISKKIFEDFPIDKLLRTLETFLNK